MGFVDGQGMTAPPQFVRASRWLAPARARKPATIYMNRLFMGWTRPFAPQSIIVNAIQHPN